MTCLVITNLYKSVVTNDILAPLSSKYPYSWDDLAKNNFKIFGTSIISQDPEFLIPKHLQAFRAGRGVFDSELDRRLLNWQSEVWEGNASLKRVGIFLYCKASLGNKLAKEHAEEGCRRLINYDTLDVKQFEKENSGLIKHLETLYKLSFLGQLAQITEFEKLEKVAAEIGKCVKSVFALDSVYKDTKHFITKIFGESGRSSLTRQPFAVSEDTVFSQRRYFRFPKVGSVATDVKNKFEKVIAAGFQVFWTDMAIFIHTTRMEGLGKGLEFSSQQLVSNLGSSFLILLVGLGTGGLGFIWEITHWRVLYNSVRNRSRQVVFWLYFKIYSTSHQQTKIKFIYPNPISNQG